MTDAEVLAADLAGQPEALLRVGRDVEWPAPGGRVRFVGVGSSAYAASFALAPLRAAGVDAAVESPEAGTPPDPSLLAFLVSASGRSPETLAAAERHAGVSRTVAITNDPDSPLAHMADALLPLAAGVERSGIAARTYRSTVALMLLLAARLTGARPPFDVVEAAADACAAILAGGAALDAAAEVLAGAGSVSVAGPRRGSALQAALMLRECPRLPAEGYETVEWSHVGLYLTVHPDHRTVVFPGSAFEAGLRDWTRRRGVPVVSIAAPADPAVAAVAETIATDAIAARLWQARGGRKPADAAT